MRVLYFFGAPPPPAIKPGVMETHKEEIPDVPTVSIQPTQGEKKIGRGESTRITEVTVEGKTYAGKKIRDNVRARSNPEWIASLEKGMRRECWLLRQLTHPNIVMAIGLSHNDSVNPFRPVLVMEFMEGGNLDDYIARNKGLGKMDELLQHTLLLDVARGLSYIHSKRVVHYMLCSRKVFLTFKCPSIPVLAKIGGFGAVFMECRRPHHMITDEETRDHISESTMATFPPEVFSGLDVNNATSIDVFSFGVIMLQILTQENPLPLPLGIGHGSMLSEVERRKEYFDLLDDDHPLKQTAIQCLSNLPQDRPTADDILSTVEKVELRTLIPIAEVNILKQAHERTQFRLGSEKGRLQSERDQLRERLDQLSEQNDAYIRGLEQRVEQLQLEKSQLESSLLRERENRRQPPERSHSLPSVIEHPQRHIINTSCRVGESACGGVGIPRGEVEILEEIDKGAWATVAKGRYRQCLVAVKWPHDRLLRDYCNIIPRLEREISIMAQLRHPNVVHFIGAVVDNAAHRLEEHPLLITELLDTNLRRQYMQCQVDNKPFGKYILHSIFLDVAYGLHCLHTHNEPIIHRDVSAPNVLLKHLPNGCWLAKISDFGSANLLDHAQTPGEGSILYAAPEVFPHSHIHSTNQPPQTVKIDIFSYGILLCEVIAAELPTTVRYPYMLQTVNDRWKAMHNLIGMCTMHCPNARPTTAEVIDGLNQIPRPPLRTQITV